MSTLQCANIHFESTANNRLQYFGSNSVGIVAGGANTLVTNNTVTTLQVNSSNVVVANSTVTQIQVAGSNAVVANSTQTILAVGGTTELTVNATAAVFAGTVADATATLRPLVNAAVTSVSGTTVEFNNIPSWVKRITIAFRGVSTSGSSAIIIQLGTSASFTTSGYLNGVLNSGGPGTSSNNTITNGLAFDSGGAGSLSGSVVRHGTMTILNIDGNNWVSSGINGWSSANYVQVSGGSVALSDILTRLRLNTFGGTETFDAGSVNILYE